MGGIVKASLVIVIAVLWSMTGVVSRPKLSIPLFRADTTEAPVIPAKTITAQPATIDAVQTTTEKIPYSSVKLTDTNLDQGTIQVITKGMDGLKTKTWQVTYINGIESKRILLKEEVTTQPINEVVAEGGKPKIVTPAGSDCDPNYSGCVPNVYPSDVDCATGSGNGPYFAAGPVKVIGIDRYGLDRDGDGLACDNG